MECEMESNISRKDQLALLETYLEDVNAEVTMILQSLQWDRKHLLERNNFSTCQYNADHRVPPDKLLEHELGCGLKCQGYTERDRLLPSPLDPEASTLVKLGTEDVEKIINNASQCQVPFKTGSGCIGNQPLTLDRLQATYTADERRAIHDAVVSRVPSCHDLSDLALLSSKDVESKESLPKSKLEILAELRDMKRRRTKYRVAAKTRNYSDVLRDVITTQMELYTHAKNNFMDKIKKEKPDINEIEEDCNRSKEISNRQQENYTLKQKQLRSKEQSSTMNKHVYKISHQSKHHKELDRRKSEYNDDAHISPKCSKSQAHEKSKNYRDKDYVGYRSEFSRNDYIKSDRRTNRRKEYSDKNREGDKYNEDFERRKRRHENDSYYNRNTVTERHPPGEPKGISDKIVTSQSRSTVTADKHRESIEKRHYYDGHSSNTHRKRHNHDQNDSKYFIYENVDNLNRKKGNVNKKKRYEAVSVKKELDGYDSYSSDDNETVYIESGSKESKTYDRHRKTKEKYRSHDDSEAYIVKKRHNEKYKTKSRPYDSSNTVRHKECSNSRQQYDTKQEKDIKLDP